MERTRNRLRLLRALGGARNNQILLNHLIIKGINMKKFLLNNGIEIPALGLGTYTIKPSAAEKAVTQALVAGYQLVDTANIYGNEKSVGRGIKASGVPRESLFVSTKIWPSEYAKENAIDDTLKRMGLDYLDILFLHQPSGDYLQAYKTLEKAYRDGKIKSIGISNFEGPYILDLLEHCEIVPQVLQVEAHPYFIQAELQEVIKPYDIKIMSWYPLGHGDRRMLKEKVFGALAEKYNKTPAQIILKWHVQMGFIVIPGSKNEEHIRENMTIFDFDLTDDDMTAIGSVNKDKRYYNYCASKWILNSFAKRSPHFEK